MCRKEESISLVAEAFRGENHFQKKPSGNTKEGSATTMAVGKTEEKIDNNIFQLTMLISTLLQALQVYS